MFIKGTFAAPKCKFTRRLIETLTPLRYRNIKTFNILEDERIRQWLKFYSNWPTFPQVYCDSNFVGGIDVVMELIENDEFDDVMPEACKPLKPEEEMAELIANNKVILFLKKSSDRVQFDQILA